MISAGYFGSKGTHLIGAYELNEIPPGQALSRQCASGNGTFQNPGGALVACQVPGTYFGGSAGGVSSNILDQIRPFRGYRSITMITPQFNSNYNSLQVLGQHRFSGASQINVAYTGQRTLPITSLTAATLRKTPTIFASIAGGRPWTGPHFHRQLHLRFAVLYQAARPGWQRIGWLGDFRVSHSANRFVVHGHHKL